MGPGLVTGAADDDPSGIATYSQAGAQFGPALLWTMLLAFPLMVAVQLASARVGRVTGSGLSRSPDKVMPRWLVLGLLALLFVANTINVGADLAAMGEASALVAGGGQHGLTVVLGVASLLLQLFVPYHRYVHYLKWLTLVLFAYVALLFMVKVDWHGAAKGFFIPPSRVRARSPRSLPSSVPRSAPTSFSGKLRKRSKRSIKMKNANHLKGKRGEAEDALARIRWDTFFGMAVSTIVALAIILGIAATLHQAGVTDIESAAEAAQALRPIVGNLAFAVFSLGIIGTGLLAVPVLAGSSAYAACEVAGWNASLEQKPMRAKTFYAIISLGVLLGIGLDWSPINPMKALFWSAVINGFAAIPILIGLMIIVSKQSIMDEFEATISLKIFGWVAVAVMGAAAIAMVVAPG